MRDPHVGARSLAVGRAKWTGGTPERLDVKSNLRVHLNFSNLKDLPEQSIYTVIAQSVFAEFLTHFWSYPVLVSRSKDNVQPPSSGRHD